MQNTWMGQTFIFIILFFIILFLIVCQPVPALANANVCQPEPQAKKYLSTYKVT